ncbi:MAG: GIY-YIG nuclease family protein [Brevundimonas sp.]
MSERRPFIATYILASRPLGVLYVGMTSNLYERIRQHRDDRMKALPTATAARRWSGTRRTASSPRRSGVRRR